MNKTKNLIVDIMCSSSIF